MADPLDKARMLYRLAQARTEVSLDMVANARETLERSSRAMQRSYELIARIDALIARLWQEDVEPQKAE